MQWDMHYRKVGTRQVLELRFLNVILIADRSGVQKEQGK